MLKRVLLEGSRKTMLQIYIKEYGDVYFGVACQDSLVFASTFSFSKTGVFEKLKRKLPADARVDISRTDFAQNVLDRMKDIYDGKGTSCEKILYMERFPSYTQRVLKTVSQIPVGYVASYSGVAKAAGGGARIVGNVMATNPFAPLVPCHRVVTSNLGLGGYGEGLRIKFDFLRREKKGFIEAKELFIEKGVLKILPVEFVLRKAEKLNSNNTVDRY